jgi:transposase
MNFLNLPNWNVIAVHENKEQTQYLVEAEYAEQVTLCPHCFSRSLVRNGHKKSVFMDVPHHGKPTGIKVWRQKYKCKNCRRHSVQPLPDIDEKHDCTRRLVEWVIAECLKRRTYQSIAEATGQAPNTVMYIFRDFVASSDSLYVPETPEWLGIDEIHFRGRYCCVLANIKERCILDLLPGRTSTQLVRRLQRMKNLSRIRVVTIDMWPAYRDAVLLALPDAIIVIDKFHVVRMANLCMDTVRKSVAHETGLTKKTKKRIKNSRRLLSKRLANLKDFEQLRFEALVSDFPRIGIAHALKEGFYAVYEATDRFEAMERLRTWKMSIPQDMELPFKPLLTALENWEPYIFNYFDLNTRVTNAYTESLNSVIRHVNRIGRGYTFEVLRSKMLHSAGLASYRKASFKRNQDAWRHMESLIGFEADTYLGASISALEGKFRDEAF